LLTLVAVVGALVLSAFLLPYFNQLSGKNFRLSMLFTPTLFVVLLPAAMVIALAAGAYPAFVLSGTRLIHVLKAGFTFTGSGTLRKSLIVLQFVISIF
jgi:putative ABC transport system permease protein